MFHQLLEQPTQLTDIKKLYSKIRKQMEIGNNRFKTSCIPLPKNQRLFSFLRNEWKREKEKTRKKSLKMLEIESIKSLSVKFVILR